MYMRTRLFSTDQGIQHVVGPYGVSEALGMRLVDEEN